MACIAALSSCGKESPAPVEIPPGFATDSAVLELLERKRAVVLEDPSSGPAHRTLGLALAANSGWELAAQCFKNAIEVEPGDAESHLQLALAYGEQGDLAGKIAKLEDAISLDASLLAARYELGCALLDDGQLDPAQAVFEGLERGKSASLAGLGLGLVALERDDLEKALEHLVRFSKAYPDDGFTKFKIGEALSSLGKDRQAAVILADVTGGGGRPVLSSPVMMEMRDYRVGRADRLEAAEGLLAAGDHVAAVGILEDLRQRDPTDIPTLNSLAIGYMETGRSDQALAVLEELIGLDPAQFGVYINLASFWLGRAEKAAGEGAAAEEREHLRAALDASAQAISLAPDLGQAHNVRGQALARLGLNDQAIAAYRKAIASGRDEDEVYLDLLQVLNQIGGTPIAIRTLEEALARDPNRFRLCYELTGLYLKSGDRAKARAQYRELVAISPNHPMTKRADEALRKAGQ